MKFIHSEKGMSMHFTWKETLRILFTGKIFFDRESSYTAMNHFMHLIAEGIKTYGDVTKHGEKKIDDFVDTK